MEVDKIQRVPSYKMLAEALVQNILDGKLKVGDALPTEAGLCDSFGVNRSTVREGVRLLEEAGMILRSGKKLIITHPSKEQVGAQVQRAMVLKEVRIEELWEGLLILDPAMAELAALRRSETAVRALQANLRETEEALQEGKSVVQLDIEFHSLVAEAADNHALLVAREPLGRLLFPAFDVVMTKVGSAGARLLTAHTAIFEAIKNKNAADAKKWMEKHIQDFKRGYEVAGVDMRTPVAQIPDQKAPGRR
jgi:DNA-binding FadR family transcriptional regulator